MSIYSADYFLYLAVILFSYDLICQVLLVFFFLLLEFYSESPCLCLSVKEFNVYLHLIMSRFISYIISFIHFHLCFYRVSDIVLALFLCTLSAQCPCLMCSVPRTVYWTGFLFFSVSLGSLLITIEMTIWVYLNSLYFI